MDVLFVKVWVLFINYKYEKHIINLDSILF